MKRVNAYSFDSPMLLRALLARLNERGPWRWIERENEGWGDYISARALPDPDYGIIKILYEDGCYIVNFNLEAEPEKLDEVCDTLFTYLLPGVGAMKLTETDSYE